MRDASELTEAPETDVSSTEVTAEDPLRALVHRWFVLYNPLYLGSATLVLCGLWLIAREASSSASIASVAGVGATAELYALALIGTAAWLARSGMRRAAAMLGLIAVVYQGDVMMRTEAAAFLPGGALLSCAWALLFPIKLVALARALELRLSRSALAVPALGALALAALPHLIRDLAPASRTAPVALAVFAIGALGLWTRREIESVNGFDVRAVRAIRATWALWSALALAHVLYWTAAFGVDPVVLLLVSMLLATRFAHREPQVWALSACALGASFVLAPGALWLVAAMTCATLLLRALRAPVIAPPPPPARNETPYRGVSPLDPCELPIARFARADRAVASRLFLGALAAAHLACWSHGYGRGLAFPPHSLALDALFTIAAVALAWRHRSALPVVPIALLHLHLARELGFVPRSAGAWGWCAVAGGFALLAIAAFVSSRARAAALDRPPPGAPPAPHGGEGRAHRARTRRDAITAATPAP